MPSMPWSSSPPRYSLATDSDDGEDKAFLAPGVSPKQFHQTGSLRKTLLCIAAATVVLLSGVFAGFWAGRHYALAAMEAAHPYDKAGDTKVVLHYNKTFASAPSADSDAAWHSIFPVGRGFIHHPTLAPNVSGFAVFHELHCLNALRMALFDNGHDANATHDEHEAAANNTTMKTHNHKGHVRHCIDYLRQSLMCMADSNLEPVDWDKGGVTGWGYQRQCRDYSGLVHFTEQWRTHNETSIE